MIDCDKSRERKDLRKVAKKSMGRGKTRREENRGLKTFS